MNTATHDKLIQYLSESDKANIFNTSAVDYPEVLSRLTKGIEAVADSWKKKYGD